MSDTLQARAKRTSRWTRLASPADRSDSLPAILSPAITGPWLGMVTGLMEVAYLAGTRWLTGEISPQTLNRNWHYVWMIPVCNLALLGSLGLMLGGLALLVRRRRFTGLCSLVLCVIAVQGVALADNRLHKLAVLAITLGGGWRLFCWLNRSRAGSRKVILRTLPIVAIVVAGLTIVRYNSLAHAESRTLASLPRAREGSPNVVLIVLDTVRANAMSLYGSSRDTTPNLARLASRGVRFEQARTPAPWTLPAHASLFTGRWPHELTANVGHPLDRSHLTLAEHLAQNGYASAAFVANTHNGNAWYGLDRGFARYEDLYENTAVNPVEILRSSSLGRKVLMSRTGQKVVKALVAMPKYRYRKTAEMINRDALAWVDRRISRPFFLFLNYYDAHDPYTVPKGVARPFADERAAVPRSALETARDDYDDCLRYLDAQVGRLVDELDHRGMMGNTLLVITSDHGEGFGEHDLSGHGISLYRPELHVPLIIVDPRRVPSSKAIVEPVSLRDIPATIAELLHPERSNPFPGQSLASLWNAIPPARDPVLSSVDRSEKVSPLLKNAPARLGRMFSLVMDGRAYIHNADGREEVYDLESDPQELHDLARQLDLKAYRATLRRMVDDLE